MAANGSMFDFETHFDHEAKQAWMATHWTLCFWFSALYLAAAFAGRQYMRSRPGFRLQGALFCWNLALASFSLLGAGRTLAEVASSLRRFGFGYSVCDDSFLTGASGFWTWLFALSKLPELGDTAFLVLRKRPLRFLHWYHHATVLCYCWYSYADRASSGRWFVAMNYTVHALMYSYYAATALGARLPAILSVAVTALQLSQMGVGCFISTWAYSVKARGLRCQVTDANLVVSLLMYASYFALFAWLFYTSYVVKRPKRQKTE